jgi:DNA polymerase-1
MLAPLCQLIAELRTLGVFQSNFIEAKLDIDGRMRTSFGIAGPTSYRFNSRENAFYTGLNCQNIPVAVKQKIKGDNNYVKLPNIRELALADPGYTYFDLDLDRADMQIVGWESGDKNLKDALRKGVDLHCWSASEVFNIRGIPVDELIESHPNYADHRAKIGKANRDKCKNGGHACDYAVGDAKLAQTLGITRHEASAFKAKWFGLFPGIRKWQIRVEEAVAKTGYIENPFRNFSDGFRNLRLRVLSIEPWSISTERSSVARQLSSCLFRFMTPWQVNSARIITYRKLLPSENWHRLQCRMTTR